MLELLMLGAAFCWAAGFAVVRGVIVRVPAVQVAAVRLMGAGSVFIAVALVTGRGPQILAIPTQNLIAIVVSVILGAGVGDAIVLAAIRHIGVARAYAIAYSYPFVAVLIAVGWLGETLSGPAIAGVFLVVVGGVLASIEPAARGVVAVRASRRRAALSTGVVLSVTAALIWGVSTNATKIAVTGIDPVVANAVRMPLAAVVIGAAATALTRRPPFARLGRRDLAIALFSGFLGLALGSALYVYALPHVGAARGAALSAPSPVFALVLSIVFLRERPGWKAILGVPVTAVGVALLTVR
ncbi:MAG: DMT family transporter [Actinobacteria bacterium]|nr:DMT family transporter [Actinomycetota bacterium]